MGIRWFVVDEATLELAEALDCFNVQFEGRQRHSPAAETTLQGRCMFFCACHCLGGKSDCCRHVWRGNYLIAAERWTVTVMPEVKIRSADQSARKFSKIEDTKASKIIDV